MSKKQRKLLTREEKEKICKDWKGICFDRKRGLCPLYFEIDVAKFCQFCYKDHADVIEHALQEIGNEEVEFNDKI